MEGEREDEGVMRWLLWLQLFCMVDTSIAAARSVLLTGRAGGETPIRGGGDDGGGGGGGGGVDRAQ